MLKETDWDTKIELINKILRRDFNSINIVPMSKWINKRIIKRRLMRIDKNRRVKKTIIMSKIRNNNKMIKRKMKNQTKMASLTLIKQVITRTWIHRNKNLNVNVISPSLILDFMTVVGVHNHQVVRQEVLTTAKM